MGKDQDNEKFSEKEAQARFEAALRGGLNTPHKPLKEKPKVKKAAKKTKTKKNSQV
jgi:hypothetical protein